MDASTNPIEAAIAGAVATFDPDAAAVAEVVANAAPLLEATDAPLKQVREGRLELKRVRTAIEARRKALKEDSLRYGRAVDARAKELTAMIKPTEDQLQAREDALKAEEEARKEAERRKRLEALETTQAEYRALGEEVPLWALEAMSPEELEADLERARAAKEARDRAAEEARAAEEERRAREAAERAAERAELEAARAELARLRAEAEAAKPKPEPEPEPEPTPEEVGAELAHDAAWADDPDTGLSDAMRGVTEITLGDEERFPIGDRPDWWNLPIERPEDWKRYVRNTLDYGAKARAHGYDPVTSIYPDDEKHRGMIGCQCCGFIVPKEVEATILNYRGVQA